MVPLKLQTEVFKLSPRVLTSFLSGLSLKKKKKKVSPLPSVSLPLPQDNLLDLQPRMRHAVSPSAPAEHACCSPS